MSAEHVWPQWLRETPEGAAHYANRVYSRDARFITRVSQQIGGSDPTVVIGHDSLRQAVPAMDVTVKVVCRPCNNGWMASLEGETKPILERLMRTGASGLTVSGDAVRSLRRWAIKTTAMLEFNDPPTRSFDDDVLSGIHRGDDDLPGLWRVGLYRAASPEDHFRLSHSGGSYFEGHRSAGPGVTFPGPVMGRFSQSLLAVHDVLFSVVHASGPWRFRLTQGDPDVPPPAALVPGLSLRWPAPSFEHNLWTKVQNAATIFGRST